MATKEVLTPEDLAREWKVSRNLIYRELRANRIPHYRAGDRYLISREIAAKLLRGAKRRERGTRARGGRGQNSWPVLLAFWGLSIMVVEIIISSEFIFNHRVIVGLLNVGALVYLDIRSVYFKRGITGWYRHTRLVSLSERI